MEEFAPSPKPPRAGRHLENVATGWRFVRVLVHFSWGWTQAQLLLPLLHPERRRTVVASWCLKLLRVAGVTVIASGPRAARPAMVVSNHVSWLDVIAIQAVCPVRFVAKSEVRAWPLVGRIAGALGTVFVERGRARSAAQTAAHVAELLRSGEVIVLFPEGTTTDGSTVQPFRAALLQAPIDAHVRVQPLAITYREPGAAWACSRAAYRDADSLLGSIWRTVSAPVTVRLVFGAPFDPRGLQRRELATSLHRAVSGLWLS